MLQIRVPSLCLAALFLAGCSSEATSGDSEQEVRDRPRDVSDDGTSEPTDAADTSDPGDAATDTGDVSADPDVDPTETDASDTESPDTDPADADSDSTDSDADVAEDLEVADDSGDGEADSDTADEPEVDPACLDFTLEATGILRPVDIVWAIDASPSMEDEIGRIEAELNRFAAGIETSGLDYRVVLIGSDREQSILAEAHDYFEICVPPPLSGAPGCPDTDGPRFLHVREPIHSREALAETRNTFAEWRSFLRPDANVHFVMVTDDDERGASSVSTFTTFADTTAGLLGRWTLHSVVDLIVYNESCFFDDTCSCGSNRGSAYLELSEATDGLALSICEDNWTSLFDALRERVAVADAVPCTFAVPTPGEEYEVDYDDIGVRQTTGGTEVSLPRVADAAACSAAGGWYFDNNTTPSRILLCAASCADDADSLAVDMDCVRRKI